MHVLRAQDRYDGSLRTLCPGNDRFISIDCGYRGRVIGALFCLKCFQVVLANIHPYEEPRVESLRPGEHHPADSC
jgi:hypothetical protein